MPDYVYVVFVTFYDEHCERKFKSFRGVFSSQALARDWIQEKPSPYRDHYSIEKHVANPQPGCYSDAVATFRDLDPIE